MFSSRLKHVSRQTGFRLSVGYLALFLLSSAAFFVLLYVLLNNSLADKDKEIIESHLKQYTVIYESSGLSGLRHAFERQMGGGDNSNIVVRVANAEGRTLFIHVPKSIKEYDLDVVASTLSKKGAWSGAMVIPSKDDPEDALELISTPLKDGSVLQVGKDTDDREDVLDRFRRSFLILMLPLFLLGVTGALIFTRRTLLPLRELVATMKVILGGDVAARVKRTQNGDEFDDLGLIFNQMLEKVEALISGMRESLDFVAHDLRTPMTRFRGLAERALRSGNISEMEEALGESLESSDQILNLLNTIMEISEAEAGAIELHRSPTFVDALLGRAADLYSVVADDIGVEITIEAEHVSVSADVRLLQAIANLVDNALKFAKPHGKVRLAGFARGSDVVIEVRDDGQGIKAEDLPKIWDRLYRADSSRSTRGMGLGLSLVRSIVKAHNGTVHVTSEYGSGSLFQIILPRVHLVELKKKSLGPKKNRPKRR
jgi:signal transduction histidine kinase